MTTHREGDREVCDRCGDSWDRKSTAAIYGHVCADEAEAADDDEARDDRITALERRVQVLEDQVRSLQIALPKGIGR